MDERSELIDRLAWELSSWKSVDLRVRSEQAGQSLDGKPTGATMTVRSHYSETDRGQRAYDLSAMSDGREMKDAAYCDGSKCIKLNFDTDGKQQSAAIDRSFYNEARFGAANRPRPLEYFYVGLTPLHEALPKAERTGSGTIIGRKTDIYVFRGVKCAAMQFDFVYHLDDITGIPLRAECYRDAEMMAKGLPAYAWEADSLDAIGKYHLPKKSHYSSFVGHPATGKAVPATTQKIAIEEVTYDAPIPDSRFWPSLTPGVQVLDGIKNESYVVPGAEVSSTAEPLRAAPPGEAWMSQAPTIGVVVCAAFLIAGGVLWWRRR